MYDWYVNVDALYLWCVFVLHRAWDATEALVQTGNHLIPLRRLWLSILLIQFSFGLTWNITSTNYNAIHIHGKQFTCSCCGTSVFLSECQTDCHDEGFNSRVDYGKEKGHKVPSSVFV